MVEFERPLLELRDIGRVFGPASNQTASLVSVSLRVYPGEFVAIIGPSGAGKSTLLNILGLLDRPTSGVYLLDGIDVTTLSEPERDRLRNERLGFVFQHSHLLLDDTAASNATLSLKVRGATLEARRASARSTLSLLRLSHRARERTLNLSGGERQRVAIARAISTQPDIILADEPTGALDSENSRRILDHLLELNSAGTTVLIITHDPTVAAAAQRQVHLVDGGLTAEHSVPAAGRGGRRAVPLPRPASALARWRRAARRIADEFLDAIASQTSNPGRSLLLLLAFTLGIGGLVSSIGIAQSAAVQVATRLTAASLDEVVVRSADPAAYAAGYYLYDRQPHELIAALNGVSGVGMIAPLSRSQTSISLLPGMPEGSGVGVDAVISDAGYLALMGVEVAPDGASTLLNNSWSGSVAILGEGAADALGITFAGPGAKIWVRGLPVDVIGLIRDTGRAPELKDTVVLTPAAAAGAAPEDPRLVVRTLAGMPAVIAEAVPAALSPGNPSDVRVETVADLRDLQTGVASDLSALVGAVSALLLMLAALTSSVAMYLSVQSRRSEVALRRAVGASRSSIYRLFMMEGLVTGLAGGRSGAAVGICGVVLTCYINGWSAITDPLTVAMGIVLGALTGVVSAAYPALVAARADPALAIRE